MKDKKVFCIVNNQIKNDNRVLNEAFSLASNGYEVYLVGIIGLGKKTSLPREEFVRGVKIFRKSMISERMEALRFIRIMIFQTNIWFYFFIQSKKKFDVVHCHDLSTLHYGVMIKLWTFSKIKLVYDAHEYETEMNGLQGFKKTYLSIKERFLIRFVDKVITVSDSIADEYVRLYGIERPELILNCPVLRTEKPPNKDLFRSIFDISNEHRILLYQGGLEKGRGIEIMLEAFSSLNTDRYVLVFLGSGQLTDEIKSHENYGEFVFHHPYVSGEVLLEYTSSADYGIVYIEDTCLSYRYCMPNKLFECIAGGLPVICSNLPEIRDFVERQGVGISAIKDGPEGFLEMLERLPDPKDSELKSNILKTRSAFNWGTQEKILIKMYNQLLN